VDTIPNTSFSGTFSIQISTTGAGATLRQLSVRKLQPEQFRRQLQAPQQVKLTHQVYPPPTGSLWGLELVLGFHRF
jgi:hypothetical protein